MHTWCRARPESIAVAALIAACLHAIVLPYQWRQSFALQPGGTEDADIPSTSKAADCGAPETSVPDYVWAAPFQLIFALPTGLQRHRCWPRDVALYGLVGTIMLSSFVYPMDWGREYQRWPLPTLYAAICAFAIAQAVEGMSCLHASKSKQE